MSEKKMKSVDSKWNSLSPFHLIFYYYIRYPIYNSIIYFISGFLEISRMRKGI